MDDKISNAMQTGNKIDCIKLVCYTFYKSSQWLNEIARHFDTLSNAFRSKESELIAIDWNCAVDCFSSSEVWLM